MSLTYQQLSQLIADYLQQADPVFINNVPNFIRQAEDRIHKAVLLPNFKNNQVGSLVAGNRFLTTPTDFLAPFYMTLINNGNYTPLMPKDPSFIYELFPNISATAPPRFYALYTNNTFILAPTPDQGYQVELEYFYKPTSIVDAGNSWLGDNADSCLLYSCLIEAYTFNKGEPDLIKQYDTKYKEALSDLRRLGEGLDERDAFRSSEVKMPVMQ